MWSTFGCSVSSKLGTLYEKIFYLLLREVAGLQVLPGPVSVRCRDDVREGVVTAHFSETAQSAQWGWVLRFQQCVGRTELGELLAKARGAISLQVLTKRNVRGPRSALPYSVRMGVMWIKRWVRMCVCGVFAHNMRGLSVSLSVCPSCPYYRTVVKRFVVDVCYGSSLCKTFCNT